MTATVDDADAKIASLEAKVEDIITKIGETEVELASATSLREKEHQDFSNILVCSVLITRRTSAT